MLVRHGLVGRRIQRAEHCSKTLLNMVATEDLDAFLAKFVAGIEFTQRRPPVAVTALLCRRLAAPGWFPYATGIGYMKVNQVTESVQAGHGRSVGRQPLIDQGLGLARPFLGVVTAQERLARVAALPSDLDPVSTGGKLGDRGHFRVRYVCSESSKQGILGAIRA
jgi:hypothetical protein